MNRARFILVLLISLAAGSAASGREKGSSVADLAWLAGHWRGEGLGGECEEIWSAPMAGTMVGTFRLVKDGEVQFYELLVLVREGEHIVMKVKHFTPAFVGWEEKEDAVEFVLEDLAPNRARFEGLTLERTGDALNVGLQMHRKDGTVERVPFRFRRYEP